MRYEIRVWNDSTKMPNITPQKAANMITQMKTSINKAGGTSANPDILIDKDAGGADAIKSVSVSYITKSIDKGAKWGFDDWEIQGKTSIRVIKIDIKGNLYLPLDEGLTGDAKSMVGMASNENKIRDTLLLSQWASLQPEDDNDKHYYRGIIISVLTKAGDFRVITAKNVYVENYTENYQEGEFGTFSMTLLQRADKITVKSKKELNFKVDGLGHEKISLTDQLATGVEKAAGVVAMGNAAVNTATSIAKKTVTTVEKFTGETDVTRWLKYGLDVTASTSNLINSQFSATSKIIDNQNDVKGAVNETLKFVTQTSDYFNDNIKKGVDTKEEIPLAQMEAMYLSRIRADPARYEAYLHMSDAEKRAELEKAAGEIQGAAQSTKKMEAAITNFLGAKTPAASSGTSTTPTTNTPASTSGGVAMNTTSVSEGSVSTSDDVAGMTASAVAVPTSNDVADMDTSSMTHSTGQVSSPTNSVSGTDLSSLIRSAALKKANSNSDDGSDNDSDDFGDDS